MPDLTIDLAEWSKGGYAYVLAANRIEVCYREKNPVLDLSDLELTSLPSVIGLLTHLEKLNLSNNRIQQLPLSINRLVRLKELNLWRNPILDPPEDLKYYLPSLQKLTIDYKTVHYPQRFEAQPDSSKDSSTHCSLFSNTVNHSQMAALTLNRKWELAMIRLQKCFILQTEDPSNPHGALLDLRGLGLTSFPPTIGKLTDLRWLFLDGNQLSELPADIGKLIKLEELSLRRNRLKALPTELSQLSHLIWLDCSNNQLRTVPEDLAKLTSLEHLDLSGNPIEKIPLVLLNKNFWNNFCVKAAKNRRSESGLYCLILAHFLIVDFWLLSHRNYSKNFC